MYMLGYNIFIYIQPLIILLKPVFRVTKLPFKIQTRLTQNAKSLFYIQNQDFKDFGVQYIFLSIPEIFKKDV